MSQVDLVEKIVGAHVDQGMLQSIVEGMPIRVFWKDCHLRYLGCNALFAKDAGLNSPAELIGKTDFDLVWKDRAEAFRRDDVKVIRSEVPKLSYEEPNTSADGRTVWVRTSKVPLRDASHNVVGILGIFEDITEHKLAEQTQQRLTRALKILSKCNQLLIHGQNEQQLLNDICQLVVDNGYLMAWVGFAEDDPEKTVRPVAQSGTGDQYLTNAHITWADTPRGQGPTGTAIRNRVTVVNQDCLTNPSMAPWRTSALQMGYQSSAALPLICEDRVLGAFTLYAPEPNAFMPEEVTLLDELAKDLAFGIVTLRTRAQRDQVVLEQKRHDEDLLQSLEDSVKAIAATVEARDPYTSGHQIRVGQLAVAMARFIGLPQEVRHGIWLAAIVHDLGKISVPAEILSKPGRLTEVELMLVKQHVQRGYDILKDIRFPWPLATIVLQHHERMDGSGYPQGLKGGQTLLESRILAVADVVESMVSHRPYRPALGIDAALAEIERGRGTIYDATVVDACLAVFRQQNFAFQK